MKADRYTNTEHDAGQYEAHREPNAYDNDRPTRLEAERDNAADDPCFWGFGCTETKPNPDCPVHSPEPEDD